MKHLSHLQDCRLPLLENQEVQFNTHVIFRLPYNVNNAVQQENIKTSLISHPI